MKSETKVSMSTKIGKESHTSQLTINWEGMTSDDLQVLAQRSIVIRIQNGARTNNIIPKKEYTVKAIDYRIGVRTARPVTLSAEQMLEALPEDEVLKMLEARLAKSK